VAILDLAPAAGDAEIHHDVGECREKIRVPLDGEFAGDVAGQQSENPNIP
jgi:hypothetical protein